MNDGQKSLIHLICGPIGAGKTTYSRELAALSGGVVFSIDEWMVSLFGEDAPKSADPDWIFPRVDRCEKQMWAMAKRLGALHVPSILDFGFQRYEHRRRYINFANEAGLAAKMHVLDVEASERWKRIEARNTTKGETFHLVISRGMFDYIEATWEQPSEDETASVSRTSFD
ncbi:ATP-binding protein [Labrenzia sp. PHM005]|uniref:AAA family ATPase n=1 Tax=Labrenzia sp. PHM005 TaxID=2590016 RepID=UPI00114068F6|nr:ATP-binding protein [Labrenzia sp. PHM005]QDG76813.1 ATP-binding protein [Labrenzia sp. PHM005]